MSKYQPLTAYLRTSGSSAVRMTFEDSERIIGARLPESAGKHRAYWSNNPTNSVLTSAWLKAGYRSTNVNMTARELVFRKAAPNPTSDGTGEKTHTPHSYDSVFAGGSRSFDQVFGALRGTVTITPGTDLTDPIGEDWDAAK